jgi:hypothetical protein
MGLDELVDTLRRSGLCLDLSEIGGAIYLDATSSGLPLRKLVSEGGRPNYLAWMLRELVPLIPGYQQMVLVHDRELAADYVLLDRVLTRLGANVCRVALDRVAIGGVVRSSRHGDWRRHTASAFSAALVPEVGLEAFRLGMRLYFIAVLGKSRRPSFDYALLRRWTRRARRLLGDRTQGTEPHGTEALMRRCAGCRPYVDPYRLTSSLLGSPVTLNGIAELVYL